MWKENKVHVMVTYVTQQMFPFHCLEESKNQTVAHISRACIA